MEKLFDEYKKCIDALTVDDSRRNKMKIQKLEEEKSELAITKKELEKLKRDVRIIKEFGNLII